MFVDPIRGRSQGYALAAAAVFTLGACDDPTQNTDLRPEGPPEVLAVLVMTDAAFQLAETATYCAPDDPKRPGLVGLPDFTTAQVCDDDLGVDADMVTDAYPDGWFVRIMFDELLDPNIEELTELIDPDTGEGTDVYSGSIANTRPVRLECESVGGGFIDVEYDGYYSPSGNTVTWPLGPALVIKPNNPLEIATGKMCRITINENVVDKSGTPVPAEQRGPFPFRIAPISPIFIDPGEGDTVDALQIWYDNMYVQFNTEPDPTSFCTQNDPNDPFAGCDPSQPISFMFTDEQGQCSGTGDPCVVALNGTDCAPAGQTCDRAVYAYPHSGTEFGFGPFEPLETDKAYTFSFVQGGTVRDRCGVTTTFDEPIAVSFTTNEFDLDGITPGDGDIAPPLRKPTFAFNNIVDLASFTGDDVVISPLPDNFAIVQRPEGPPMLAGDYALATEYTLTYKAGSVLDYYGTSYNQATDEIIRFTTQPEVTLSLSPSSGSTLSPSVAIALSFNQSMDEASLDPTEWSITPAATLTRVASGCSPSSTSCAIALVGTLTPGDYTFTLKANATITGVQGSMFTQPTDRVIEFTVQPSAPPVQCL